MAVIGGGLTGLAAAHRLVELARDRNEPIAVTLFEAGPRLGGLIATRDVEGYLVEMGADSFITNKPWAVRLCERLGIADRLIPTDSTFRRSLVLRNGRPVPVPEGFMLLSPAKVWPVLTSPIFSPWGKLRMGLEYVLPRRSTNGDESLASFVRRRFGREALDRLVQPLVGGIYTSDPEKLSLAATMPRFLDMEREHGSLIRASRKGAGRDTGDDRSSGARYGLFATPKNGLRELFEALTARLTGTIDLRVNTAVTSLTPLAAGDISSGWSARSASSLDSRSESTTPERTPRWQVSLADGTTHRFDAVLLTLHAHRAADLVAGCSPALSNSLREIEYASSAVVVTGHRLADIRHPLDAFGLVIPHLERRNVIAVSFSSRKFPGRAPEGRVLLRTFVGGAMQPEMLQHTDDELIAIVRDELQSLLGVTGTPDFALVARYTNAMPQYHVGHLDRVARIESEIAALPGLALAGNAYHGVGIPDCIHSGEQAAESLLPTEIVTSPNSRG